MGKHDVTTIEVVKERLIAAPIDVCFEAVLEEIGPGSELPDGKPFPMVIEPFPGGRWYRDLGENRGHLWGHVQVIKPPTILEISGPMFVSHPASNHVQYRLTAEGEQTRLKLTHRAMAWVPENYFEGVDTGWEHGLKRIAELAARRVTAKR
ncbi:MAG TPA: SRPBCC domain-containing protein [Tepidisphaeraceae bacterium]|nr:SRPBCC domain-containing protein [Tepidisphaeraceae bacterium]